MKEQRGGIFQLLTAEELAEEWGVTTGNLAQMRHRGQGPKFIRINGRNIRYRVSDVEEYLNQQRTA